MEPAKDLIIMPTITRHNSLGHYLIMVSSFLLLLSLGSCGLFKKVDNSNNNNDPTHLDPVVGKNTNPSDTSKTGTYTPIVKVDPEQTNPTASSSDTLYYCDTVQQDINTRLVICFEKIGSGPIKADTVQVIRINDNAIFNPTPIVVDSTVKKKIAYRVVVMLPFMSQNFNPSPTKEIPAASIRAVEFYEGVLLALDSLKREGVSLFVNTYDTQRDTAVVQRLLTSRALQEADMIIGPLGTDNLKLVAEFAKNNQKPMIVPFNSRTDITINNPYYLQLNPSFEIHSRYMIERLHQIKPNRRVAREGMEKNIIILALERDSNRVAKLQEDYSIYKNDFNAKLPTVLRANATIDISDIKSLFDKSKMNIVVMPTYRDESFVYNCLREIQKLVDKLEPWKGHQVAIVGMDHWRYYTRVNFEYFESLNLHLTSNYHTSTRNPLVRSFRNAYKSSYGIGAREFSFIGFDAMLYFGRMIHKYGVNFQPYLSQEPQGARHTRFQFGPSYQTLVPLDSNPLGPQSIFRTYENQYLHFLKFEDYDLEKITDGGEE